jgi:hypothetical protein
VYFWLFAVPISVGLMAFAWSRWSLFIAPAVEAPEVIDLGLHDNNKVLETDVSIRNKGYRPLELRNFAVSCPSCLTIGLPAESGMTDISEYTIPSGESLTLAAHINMHGIAGRRFTVALFCDTNDPRQRVLSIAFEAAVRGEVFVSPPELDLDTLQPGQTVRRTFEVRDNGRGSPCSLSRVVSPAPDVVQLRLSPVLRRAETSSSDKTTEEVVGTVDVEVKAPTSAWTLDNWVAVYEEGRDQPLARVPIRARVLAAFQATPASLVFPRVVGDRDVYSADCDVSSTAGQAIHRIEPLDLPPEIRATRLEADRDKTGRASYRLEWHTEHLPPPGQARTVTVRFQVTTDTGTEIITVPVRCSRLD